MPHYHHDDIGLLDWDAFMKRLETTRWSSFSPSPFQRSLRQFFGREQSDLLQGFTERSKRVRAKRQVRGNVVLVPGTMCSNMTTPHEDGFENMLWMNLLRIAVGQTGLLQLEPDGTPDPDQRLPVTVNGVLKYAYAVALVWLHAHWNIRPYGYDWRMDLDGAADGLADFIQAHYPYQPVHLVAHSMGGMVARNFIRRHPDLWKQMQDPELEQGGRLIQIATPNYGSYLATQAMSGEGWLFWALNLADLRDRAPELIRIIDTFVANYQMLPAPDKIPAATQAIFQQETWGKLPVFQAHFDRARELYQQLEDPATRDANRMMYIGGYGFRTPDGLKVVKPGVFKHTFTPHGDGVVIPALGTLPDVPTWYAFGSHFTLPAQPRVLAAIDQLLYRGKTRTLARRPPLLHLPTGPLTRVAEAVAEKRLEHDLRDITRRATVHQAHAAEIHSAERVLLARALGDDQVLKQLWQLESARMSKWTPF